MGDFKNLTNQEAVAKLKKLAEDVRTCMFCTDLADQPIAARPMSVQEVDENGNIWFISSANSNKNFEIKKDNAVQLFFAQTSDSHYLSVYGTATIYKDQATIDEVWSTVAEAWFEQGKEDPNVSVIKVTPSDAYYWDTKDGKAITLLKIAASTITGKGMDGGIEGNLNV